MNSNYIRKNYDRIVEEVNEVIIKCGRERESVRVLSVSKTFPAETVQLAINGGIRLFGENRVQEARQKIPLLTGECEFHLIGHLQSNKAKHAVKLFSLIHSIDSLSILETVNKEAEKIEKRQRILIQVNTSDEDTKSGCDIEEALSLCNSAVSMNNIDLQGLMTIGPLTEDKFLIRKAFSALYKLTESIKSDLKIPLPIISMGMSGDFPAAVEEGATMIRVGSAIFGNRDYL